MNLNTILLTATRPLLVPVLATLAGGLAQAATAAYTTDFEGGAGAGWSSATTDSSVPVPFTEFSGRFGNSAQTLTLTGLNAGEAYTLLFDLYIIDSWDGGSSDYFNIAVDGAQVFHHTFSQFGGSQTYPDGPDEQGMYGFSSWNDSIFRSVELAFTPAAAEATIEFSGSGLQSLADESWGIDNVSVWLSADLPATAIVQTSLPGQADTEAWAIDRFTITASRNLDPTTAAQAANYELRNLGPDHTYGTADDAVYALSPQLVGNKLVQLSTTPNPLQPGDYRFRTFAGLLDESALPVEAFDRLFTIEHPLIGSLENDSNGTLPSATPLPMTETPVDSTFFTAYGIGTFNAVSEVDYWRFDAEAGDKVSVHLQADDVGSVYPYVQLRNAADSSLVQASRYATEAILQNFVIPAPGTYYLRMWSDHNPSRYRMRVDQSRGIQLENEDNNAQGSANLVALEVSGVTLVGNVAGALPAADTAGDCFSLGYLNAGNSVDASLSLPDGSSMALGDLTLAVEILGNGTPLATDGSGSISFAATDDGVHLIRVTSAARDLRAQYLLNVVVTDGVAPKIVSMTLPDEGTTSTAVIDRFSVDFSEDMKPAAVNDMGNYELRSAGTDDVFGNANDEVYALMTSPAYGSGLSASFMVVDGPLQPGDYRFTLGTGLEDRAENGLAAPYVRLFAVANPTGFVLENRNNGIEAGATSLSTSGGGTPDGSLAFGGRMNANSYPYDIAKGDFDADGIEDLALANYNSDDVSVFLGNGDGTFQAAVNFPVGDGPFSVVAGDVNEDTLVDIVTGNYYGSSVSVLLGNGDGTFQAATHTTVGSNPYDVALGNLDGSGAPEILTANYSGASLSVLTRQGDGSYTRADTASGSGTFGVAVGLLNNDAFLDVVTVNQNEDNMKVFLGVGDGTLQAPVAYPVQDAPRRVALGDMDGDTKLDAVVLNRNSQSVSVLLGNGDGTFEPAMNTGGVGSDAYGLVLADLDGANGLDVAVAAYGQDRMDLLMNQGGGVLGSVIGYYEPYNPIGIVSGDWNGDGLVDLATANHYPNNGLTVWLGNTLKPLIEDPTGVLTGLGRGNLKDTSDLDFYSFSGQAGDLLSVAVEVPGNPGSSGLCYYVEKPDGTSLTSFCANSSGWGQITPVVLPADGTYYVRVQYNHQYWNEYKLRVTLARDGIQMETESNDSTGAADVLALELNGGIQEGRVHGYVGVGDPNGDYYLLGNLTEGTQITLGLDRPANSPLAGVMEVYNGAGAKVAESAVSATELLYAVPNGGDGAHYARVRAQSGAGLLAQYVLSVALEDIVPPVITSVSLPAEGTTSMGIIDRFNVGFSEDMMAGTVNEAGNYDLRSSGTDDVFGNGNDEVYGVMTSPAYASGLSASVMLVDGPLQPGDYRLTIGTGLEDRAGNALAAAYVRTFSVAGVTDFVLENRNNGIEAGATSLSTSGGGTPDGSLAFGGRMNANSYPYDIAKGDFDGDGIEDLALANYNSDDVSVFLGNGDGTFQAAVNFPVGDGPFSVVAGDVNEDTLVDIVTGNYYGSSVSVLLGNGDGTFQAASHTTVGSNPYDVELGNLDGAGAPEILTANINGGNISILTRQGDGSYARADTASGNGPFGLAVGLLNGDAFLDVAVVNYNEDNMKVFLGVGDGTLQAPVAYPVQDQPRRVALGDMDGDTNLDAVVLNRNSQSVSVLLGNGDGTFEPAMNTGGVGSDAYGLVLADLDGANGLDVAVAAYGQDRMDLLMNQGGGVLGSVIGYYEPYNPIGIVSGDWNGDGLVDLATANHYPNNGLTVWLGNTLKPLIEDPTGVLTGLGRGNLKDTSDLDFYSFSGQAGDLLSVAVEVPGNPAASQLYYVIEKPDGTSLTTFYANSYNGWGQSTPVALPADGTYYVRVSYNYQYWNEYNLRVTLVRDGIQMETEGNDSTGAADVLALDLNGGIQEGRVHGYVGVGDGNGDYYLLGNLTEGTQITLGLGQPGNSPLHAVMEIYNGAGTKVAESAVSATSLQYPIPSGGDGAHYARVRADSGAGLLAQYILSVELADVVPPVITSVSLPAEGSTSMAIIDRFSVGFSEDMMAGTANDPGNYDLRSSGTDDVFGNGNDEVYAVMTSPAYASGLSASVMLVDGPLQPGDYRLTIGTGLEDRAGNALAAEYLRHFSVAGVSGFVLENRNNGSESLATSLSTSGGSDPDGSVAFGGKTGVGSNPYDIAQGDLNGDGVPDLVVPNISSDNVSVLLGNGDGTFQPAVNYAAGNGPIAATVGEVNGDSFFDVIVADYYGNAVSIFLGNGDGTLQAAVNVSVGSNPRDVELVDLNGGGTPEVLTANEGGDNVTVLTRQLDGTYTRVDYASGNGTYGLAVGLLNADSFFDVLTVNVHADNLTVLLGNGDGTLQAPVAYATEDQPRHVVLGDLNGDTVVDAAVLNAGTRSVSVLLGNGNGTFQAAMNTGGVGSDPYHLALADFDGVNGHDVAVAAYGQRRLDLLLNQGGGVLGGVIGYSESNYPIGVVSGDWNGDGLDDLATANYHGNNVTVWLGNALKPLLEDPSGVLSGLGRGNLKDTSDLDFYSFSGQAGDLLSVAVEVPGNPGSSGLCYYVEKPDGTSLTSFCANSSGWGQITPVVLPADGTYYVRVQYNYQYWNEYKLRVTLARDGIQMETESNDSTGAADVLALELNGGIQEGRVHGYVGVGDPNGDYYLLGNLTEGTRITLGLEQPGNSPLDAVMEIYNSSGSLVAQGAASDLSLAYIIPNGGDGAHYARLRAAGGAGLLAQYILSVALEDTVPPVITSVSLPAEGTTSMGIIDRFDVGFSEDMLASTVNDSGNFELRHAGLDEVMDTADDELYGVVTSPAYASGLAASFLVTNGPLQPGAYRFTIDTGVTDRAANPLVTAYERQFTIMALPGFVFENQDNGSQLLATSLGATVDPAFDGSFSNVGKTGTPSNPHFVDSGDLDGDTNPDLVVANWSSASVSVYLGNGDGTFRTPVDYPTGSGCVEVRLGDLDGDGVLDVVAANYNASSVTVRLGAGDGTLGDALNLSMGSNPNGIRLALLDGDSNLDIVTANRGSDNVTVRLGFGDGTFGPLASFAAGDGAARLAVGDFDGNTTLDLAVANFNAHTLSVLPGDGAGAFGAPVAYATGSNPYAVEATDLDGDAVLDLAVANLNSHTVSVFPGNGDGTFQAKVDYPSGGSQPHHLLAADLDGDGRDELLASNLNGDNLGILQNNGDGTFAPTVSYPSGNGCICTVVGDWNDDGRPDLASVNYYENTLTVFLGNDTELLPADTAGHGILVAGAQGNLLDNADNDYFSFSAQAGERVIIGVDVPGRPNNSGLRYRLLGTNGEELTSFYADRFGWGQSAPVVIPRDGTYTVLVTYNYSYQGEYRLRVFNAPPPAVVEGEDNGSVGGATPMLMETNGDNLLGTAVGYIRTNGDLDYFDLGELQSGMTVFLNARLLDYASFTPVVSLYDASNGYMVEALGGRPFDSVGEVRINTTGHYYAVVRGNAGEGGLMEGYVLETQVMPTSSVAFPNLQMIALQPPPGGGLLSGDPVEVSFTVQNVGSLGTGGSSWADRLVLSPNPTYGDVDDILLGVFVHNGALASTAQYTVTETVNLPEGIDGTFYLIGQTDSGNAIAEFVLEADNVTVAGATINVARAMYPDVLITGLSGAVNGAQIDVAWETANDGDAVAPAGFRDLLSLRHAVSATVEWGAERVIGADLGIGSSLPGSTAAPLPPPGPYQLRVLADADNDLYEFNASGHASAEQNNLASVPVDVTMDLVVANLVVAPATLHSGTGTTISWEDTNLGNRSSSGNWVDRLQVINRTSGETLLNTTLNHDSSADGNLAPGGSIARQRTFQLPDGQRGVGNIEFLVTVDSNGQAVEYSDSVNAEANNTASVQRASTLAPYPDLVVSDVVIPAEGDAGQPISVTWRTHNQGSLDAAAPWTEHIYISPNADGSAAQYVTTVPFADDLAAGSFLDRNANITLPGSAEGARYLVIRTDGANAVLELDDNNNSAVSPTSVLVRRPNLTVSVMTAPSGGKSGDSVDVSWTVENLGNGAAFGSWYDRVYLSASSDGSSPQYLGQLQINGPLAAGDSADHTLAVTLPAAAPGDHYFVVRTDATTLIAESDETDNELVSDTPTVLEAPDLQITQISAP
ncbi:MAG: VCBS repeat-containing protein, partial [Verrucomicrobiales bacterium]|nr:VCBS repeat-containing protein [Verrucomicrobiales bacterium]